MLQSDVTRSWIVFSALHNECSLGSLQLPLLSRQKQSSHETSAYCSLAVINLVSSGSLGLAFDIQVIPNSSQDSTDKGSNKTPSVHPSIHPHICLWYFACFPRLNYIFRCQFPHSTPFTAPTSPAINYHIGEVHFPWHFYLWKKKLLLKSFKLMP